MLEIELERELRGVEGGEELTAVDAGDAVLERADQAQAVGGLVGFDVDDGGAVVGEYLRGDRADADPGEVGEFDAFEREGGGGGGRLRSAGCTAFGLTRPTSSKTSAVCSPRSGAGRVNATGVRERRANGPGGAQLAAVGQLHGPPEVAHREVLEREHVGGRVHGRERDAARDAAREEVGLAVLARERLDLLAQRGQRDRELARP